MAKTILTIHTDPGGVRTYRDQTGGVHREDGPAVERAASLNHRRGNEWALNGRYVHANEVVVRWVEKRHPDTPTHVEDTLFELVQNWTYGDSMEDLYAAATAAHA